jgi:hypothetical protein
MAVLVLRIGKSSYGCKVGTDMPTGSMRLLVFSVLINLGLAVPALAHGLGAQCQHREERVNVEAYFDDDTPAGDARVSVRDSAKITVAEGRTDPGGRWSFPAPAPGIYEVAVNAGAGHRVTVRLTITGKAGTLPPADGPSRPEFTSGKGLQTALGLTAIGAFALAWLAARRRRSNHSGTEGTEASKGREAEGRS